MPASPHPIGYAELYGRLRRVLDRHGPATVQQRPAGFRSYFAPTGAPVCLHGHVLADLGATVGTTSLLNLEPAADVYSALGYPLTRRAATLADEAQRLADAGWTWDDAVDVAVRLAAQDPDTEPDRRLGDDAVRAVLQHLMTRLPAGMTAPPGWPPGIVSLFQHGYPTLLLGHLAADLRADAVLASALALADAAELFTALGWTLSARALAVLTVAHRAEADGRSWGDAVEAAMAAPTGHLPAEPWDR
ncbi:MULTISPECIES: hypothetical protein [unclassified Frankia]|uniref:hypothetical protein n=1 Tax=unclassified Frankia TaxID=2632575 RepID=UPI002AD4921A|nr:MULTISPECIES: hypothetical protein [unclassified Frankia]